MRFAASLVLIALLPVATTAALDLRSFHCTIDVFTDDSRYPPEPDFIRRAEAMEIMIVDAGEVLVVEMTLPDAETESVHLPVTERSPLRLIAGINGEYSEHSVALELMAGAAEAVQAKGTLVYRTYETDHRWRFTCA